MNPGLTIPTSTSKNKELYFSVILCVLNEENRIQEALKNFLSIGADEVIVVDGGSSDRTLESLAAEPGIRTIVAGRVGLLAQRLIGIRAAKNELILLVNVDDNLTSYTVQQSFEELLGDTSLVGIQIPIKALETTYWGRCWTSYFFVTMSPGNKIEILGRPAVSYRSEFENVPIVEGIFNEDTWFRYHEESQRTNRVGNHYSQRSCPDSLIQNLRQFWRYGKSDSKLCESPGQHFHLLWHSFIRIGVQRTTRILKLYSLPLSIFAVLHGLTRGLSHLFYWATSLFWMTTTSPRRESGPD